ncbi:MAG TPA: hypothetical protein ENN87_02825 [Phycisphaerales bacterium]|nr:hypothetical protein [Phycisphaerales bacterium]
MGRAALTLIRGLVYAVVGLAMWVLVYGAIGTPINRPELVAGLIVAGVLLAGYLTTTEESRAGQMVLIADTLFLAVREWGSQADRAAFNELVSKYRRPNGAFKSVSRQALHGLRREAMFFIADRFGADKALALFSGYVLRDTELAIDRTPF